jgi:hypothetical protein
MKTIIRRSAVLIAVLALVAFAIPSLASAAGTTTIPTRHLTPNGGTIKWAVAVHNAKRCTWSSSPKVAGFNGTVTCTIGRVIRPATFRANTSTEARDYTLTVVIRGVTTTVRHLKVIEAWGARSTTTTTQPSNGSLCVGSPQKCILVLPAPDLWDVTALTVGSVLLNIACPDPGVCDQPAGDQLDAVLVAMSVGSSGMAEPGLEMGNFALVLSDGSQAPRDSITCDNSVEYALCGLGPEGPNTSFGAVIFFDAPSGSNWTSVNFRYVSSDGNSQVYVFHK